LYNQHKVKGYFFIFEQLSTNFKNETFMNANTLHLVRMPFALVFLAIMPVLLYSQRTITGTVTDKNTGEALIGATVVDKDNFSLGTITDFDGSFSLRIAETTTALRFSYTGYNTVDVPVSGVDNLRVELEAGKVLTEVVVIGYGTVRREDVTGSLQTVDSRDFNRGAITSPQELLAGKVPGVAITTGGGPDDASQIRIRGESSLGASNDPLFVVDGIPLDAGGVSGNRNPLNVINPNDIETITVLKDASATAIYGSRAAGGVILITTKKGAAGAKLKVSYSGNVSLGTPFNTVDVLSADEFRSVMAERFPDQVGLMGEASTDWQSEIYRTAFATDHSVSLTGSAGIVPYRASLGYTTKEGLLKNDVFNRYTAGINLSPGFLNNTLQVNVGFKGMLTKNQFAERGAIGAALSFDPTQPIRDPDSKYSGYRVWTLANGNPNSLSPANPVSLLDPNLRDDQSTVKRYIINASADYRLPFLPALRANLNLGYDYSFGEGNVMIPGENTVAFSFDPVNGGGLDNEYSQKRTNEVLEFYLNYKTSVGSHDIDLMGGYSWQHFYNENSFRNSNAANTPSETVERKNIANELYLLSLFSRANYTFKNRYLFTFTLRGDATSRFASENRWGLFPAVATAIKIIDNNNERFNNLKLRAGWGITGQQDIGSFYVYQARYQLSLDNARYQFGDTFINTFRPNGYDRNIKWEETTTTNIGFDFSIIKNRLSGSLDLYERSTKDLLNFIPVPAGTNLTNFIETNIGNMINRGVELAIFTSPISTSKIRWDLGANIAYNYNEITRLTATEDPDYQGIFTGGIAGGVGSNIQIHSVGFAPRSFYVFEQLYDENGNLLEGQYADRNGDGIVNDDDKYRFQKPAADYLIGLTSNMTIGKIDFSFAGRGNIGNYVYNNVATDMGYYQRLFHPTLYLQNIHRSAVDNNVANQANVTFSDHFVTNASFFRLDHITVGYTFDQLLGDFLRVYATVQNPFIITKYEGLDPEIGNGIDNNFYPRPRTFLFGVSVTF
jgi:TonB-dependent starch-binding outer membrane protein SusC